MIRINIGLSAQLHKFRGRLHEILIVLEICNVFVY